MVKISEITVNPNLSLKKFFFSILYTFHILKTFHFFFCSYLYILCQVYKPMLAFLMRCSWKVVGARICVAKKINLIFLVSYYVWTCLEGSIKSGLYFLCQKVIHKSRQLTVLIRENIHL